MQIIATKKLNLIPIGDVRFSFTKRKGFLYVGDVGIHCDTDVDITEDQYKTLMKLMKKEKTDLLTDGTDFFTTRGHKITKITHPYFYTFLENPDNKEKIHQLRFG